MRSRPLCPVGTGPCRDREADTRLATPQTRHRPDSTSCVTTTGRKCLSSGIPSVAKASSTMPPAWTTSRRPCRTWPCVWIKLVYVVFLSVGSHAMSYKRDLNALKRPRYGGQRDREAPGYCPSVYTLRLPNGKFYVGSTANPVQRITDHCTGRGAAVTRESGVDTIHSINRCSSLAAAKRAESKVYKRMRDHYGPNNVRGAGNSARFSLSERNRAWRGRLGQESHSEEEDYELDGC